MTIGASWAIFNSSARLVHALVELSRSAAKAWRGLWFGTSYLRSRFICKRPWRRV